MSVLAACDRFGDASETAAIRNRTSRQNRRALIFRLRGATGALTVSYSLADRMRGPVHLSRTLPSFIHVAIQHGLVRSGRLVPAVKNLVIASFLSRDDFVILRFLTKEISVRSSQTLATAVSPASSSFQNLYGVECGRMSARTGLQNSMQTLRDPIRGVETWTTADDNVPSLSLSSP